MQKTNISDLDIPIDDIDCWLRYPKYHWVYDLSRLFDAQNIKWAPFKMELLSHKELIIDLQSKSSSVQQGYLYTHQPAGHKVISEIFVIKGEIKYMRHIDPVTNTVSEELVGGPELRLSAFVSLHFQKFTGIISAETCSNEIHKIRLLPHLDITKETDSEIIKLVKRIYKKNENSISA